MCPNPQETVGSHLLKKSLIENFIFCAVLEQMFSFYLFLFYESIPLSQLSYITNKFNLNLDCFDVSSQILKN